MANSIHIVSWRDDHVQALPALANNPRVAANMAERFPSPYTLQDAQRWVATVSAPLLDPNRPAWAIEADGQLAGGIGLRRLSGAASHCGVISYWLGEAFWGQGIATAALRQALSHGIDTMGLVRVETTVFSWNVASARVLTKCGFEHEGTLRKSFNKLGALVDRDVFAFVCERNG